MEGDPRSDEPLASFGLHRYLFGRGGAVTVWPDHLVVRAPGWSAPLEVPLDGLASAAIVDLTDPTPLWYHPLVVVPQRQYGWRRLLHLNLLLFLSPWLDPPAPSLPPSLRGRSDRPVGAVGLRVRRVAALLDLLEDLGVPIDGEAEQVEARLSALERDARD